MKTTANPVTVRELVLFAVNDFQTYSRSITPALDNLRKKMKRGQYDATKAVKLWEHVAEFAARRYASDFATPAEWCAIFTAADRRAAAVELLEYYADELNPA